MQDEVNTKVVAIAIKGGKISAEVLEKALKKFVEEIEKAQKTASQPKTYRGKQSIRHSSSSRNAYCIIHITPLAKRTIPNCLKSARTSSLCFPCAALRTK